jgi:hypothetical protein
MRQKVRVLYRPTGSRDNLRSHTMPVSLQFKERLWDSGTKSSVTKTLKLNTDATKGVFVKKKPRGVRSQRLAKKQSLSTRVRRRASSVKFYRSESSIWLYSEKVSHLVVNQEVGVQFPRRVAMKQGSTNFSFRWYLVYHNEPARFSAKTG